MTAVKDDLNSRLNREMERNRLRVRNGLRLVNGEKFARTGASPKDVVWRSRKAELWRYRPMAPKRFSTPILLYIGLISRSYVLDLFPGNSLVERLLKQGFDVFVFDWGVPDEVEAEIHLATYIDEVLPRAVKAVSRLAGSLELNLVAYCMGGTLTLIMLGLRDDLPVRSLTTMATPVDFHKLGKFYQPLISGMVDPAKVIDETGNVPPNMIDATVRVQRPTGDMVQYANLWQNMWNESFLEGFQAMREWVGDHIPLPGAIFREVLQSWLIENSLMNGTMHVGGRPVDLGRIKVPVMCLIAEHDEMVPVQAAAPLPLILRGVRARVELIHSGHISLICGRGMERKTMPALVDWLQSNSDPSPAATEGLSI